MTIVETGTTIAHLPLANSAASVDGAPTTLAGCGDAVVLRHVRRSAAVTKKVAFAAGINSKFTCEYIQVRMQGLRLGSNRHGHDDCLACPRHELQLGGSN